MTEILELSHKYFYSSYHKKTLKTAIDISKWNSKRSSGNLQEGAIAMLHEVPCLEVQGMLKSAIFLENDPTCKESSSVHLDSLILLKFNFQGK